MPIAFKEWAVTVRALAEGEQLVTMRKGGIREENKNFELEHERFFLYPTFDHQRNDLVRQSHHPELRRALEEGVWPDEEPPPRALVQDGGIPQPDRVRIRAWAEVTDHFTIDDRGVVDDLSPFYVWTPDYAEKRLKWKRRHPLHVLLLRVHRIPRPVTVRVKDDYHGCRSWVEIDRDLPFEGTPVMADEEFERARIELQGISGGPAAVADAIAGAAGTLDCDLCVLLDVGGDVLAHGDEAGLASPLCDAVMLAAAARLSERIATVAAVYGPGCDGELSADEV